MNQRYIRCGWCKRDEGELYEVHVTSAGKPFDSLAHKECAERWGQVSQVKLGEKRYVMAEAEREIVRREKVFHTYSRSHTYFLRHKEKVNHRCECGKLIHPNATHCNQCAGVLRRGQRQVARSNVSS